MSTEHNTGEPRDAELLERFEKWWGDEGSGLAPKDGEEHCFHAERVARIAWLNGAFVSGTRPRPALHRAGLEMRLKTHRSPQDRRSGG